VKIEEQRAGEMIIKHIKYTDEERQEIIRKEETFVPLAIIDIPTELSYIFEEKLKQQEKKLAVSN